jgi:hypothetical protein
LRYPIRTLPAGIVWKVSVFEKDGRNDRSQRHPLTRLIYAASVRGARHPAPSSTSHRWWGSPRKRSTGCTVRPRHMSSRSAIHCSTSSPTKVSASKQSCRARRQRTWEIAGLPRQKLPASTVMSTEDMVDAALVGLETRANSYDSRSTGWPASVRLRRDCCADARPCGHRGSGQ